MRLLLADDHGLFREAIVEFIQRAEPGATVVTARDIHEVMDILNGDEDTDIVLLDLRMPGMNGLQGLQKLRETFPEVAVALLSGMAEKQDVERALELGAVGYFPKTLSGKAMLAGIKEILAGGVFVARDHNTNDIMPSNYEGYHPPRHILLGEDAANDGGNPNVRLTPRERDVLGFLKRGESNKEIARELDLQVVTVKLHVRGICRKLGAKNRTQAALIAQEQGI